MRKTRFMASVFTGATVAPLFSTLTALWSHFIVNCSNIVQTGTHFAAYHAFTIYMGTYMPDPVASPLASAAVSGTLGAVAGASSRKPLSGARTVYNSSVLGFLDGAQCLRFAQALRARW